MSGHKQKDGHVRIYGDMGWHEPFGGVMWSFGYTEWEPADSSADPIMRPIEVNLGDDRSFAVALSELLKHVQNEANEAEEAELSEWSVLIADIRDIHDDPGIMGDSDMWEDETFYGPKGVEYWVVEF